MKHLTKLVGLLLLSLAFANAQTSCVGTCSFEGTVTVPPPTPGVTLSSISVDPANPHVLVGQQQTFSALGTYSDGSTNDVTGGANWISGNPAVASHVTNVFTCLSSGTSQVTASIGAVSGNTTLTCQTLAISPAGPFTAFQNQAFTAQLTASGGTPPYTFTGSGLPGWLSLTSGGLLSGTPTSIAQYNFTVSVSDSAGHSLNNVPYSIFVVAAQGEDNTYCNSNGTWSGASSDNGANLPTTCVYTAIASTPANGQIWYVCPPNEIASQGGSVVAGCSHAQQAGFTNYWNSTTAALASPNLACGTWIQIYPASWVGGTTLTQNVYNETWTLPPLTCSWGTGNGGVWISPVQTSQMALYGYESLPNPGNRLTPAWGNQASIPSRPAYTQRPPSGVGPYIPQIVCVPNGFNCYGINTPSSSAGISAWRFIGLEFTAPHGRDSRCANNFNGTPQCSPGFSSALVDVGCTGGGQNPCGNTGATQIILDRIWVHGCTDKSTSTCLDDIGTGVQLQGGQYLALIDSYVNDIHCIDGQVGACNEAHGVFGGNARNLQNDGPVKVTNTYIESSTENSFWGGGGSNINIHFVNFEFRKNHLYKPLVWMYTDPTFPGTIPDGWVQKQGSGYDNGGSCSNNNSPCPACVAPAPGNSGGTTATCHFIVVSGKINDIVIDNPGSGYGPGNRFKTCCLFTVNANGGGGSGAVVYPLMGRYSIKNIMEFKHGQKVLIEGNIFENVWTGQAMVAPQQAYALLLTPKNPNNNCPTCTDQDITIRYNLLRNMGRGIQIGTEGAAQCVSGQTCIPEQVGPVSIHDVIFDGINGSIWNAFGGTPDSFSGQCIQLFNLNPPPIAVQNIKVNHIHCITTMGGASAAYGSGLNFNYNPAPQNIPSGPSISLNTTGGSLVNGHTIRVQVTLNLINSGGETAPSAEATINTASCSGGNSCSVTVSAPVNTNPSYGSWTVYSSDNGAALSELRQSANNACVSLAFTATCTIKVGGAGPAPPNALTVETGISFTNSIAAGGVKNTAQLSNGGFQCNNSPCTSELALRSLALSDNNTQSGGFYNQGQVISVQASGGSGCTSAPTITMTQGGNSSATGTCRVSGGAVTSCAPSAVGGGYTMPLPANFVVFGAGCSVNPTNAIAYLGAIGQPGGGSWCYDHNINVLNAWPGLNNMDPYPTAQGDATNNTCAWHAGGGNLSPNGWSAVQFVNFPISGGSEVVTPDLHLQATSPGHNAACDGGVCGTSDIGANVDLVLGKSDGSQPSPYTGITIDPNTKMAVLPQ